jgi:hypothetical protein
VCACGNQKDEHFHKRRNLIKYGLPDDVSRRHISINIASVRCECMSEIMVEF